MRLLISLAAGVGCGYAMHALPIDRFSAVWWACFAGVNLAVFVAVEDLSRRK